MKKTKEQKKTKGELVLVKTGNDWEGLFVNGKKVCSHHKVDVKTISEYSAKMGVVVQVRFTTDAETEKAEDCGDFPENLSEMELSPE